MAGMQANDDRLVIDIDVAAVRRWFAHNWLDLVFLAGLALVAGAIRLTMLTEIPAGLHGDEAWTGIDAVRILDEGWIGVYVRSALGQPAGPMYFAAPFVAVFGETVFSIRLAMAVVGIATVLVTYLAARAMFDRTVAVFAAVLLAVGVWHVHYSRLAFPVITWPFVEVATMLFLFLGIKTGKLYHFALAGLFFGGGIYTYNAYPIFVIATSLAIAGWMVIDLYRASNDRLGLLTHHVLRVGAMAVVSGLVALPLLLYAADSDNEYFNHNELVSIFETDEWHDAGLGERVDIVWDSAWHFYKSAFWSGDTDEADGAGEEAMVDRVTVALLIFGALILLWRWKRPASVAVLLLVLILPVATIITTQGTYRQPLGIVPFLAMMAAVPLAWLWRESARLKERMRYLAYGGIATIVGLIAFLNLSFYFGEFPDTHVAGVTFNPQLIETVEFMGDLPDDYYIYFFSGRWGFNYEPKRYLIGDRSGEDRSEEFGQRADLEPDPTTDVAYVFMAPYLERIDEVEAQYPGGEHVDGGNSYQAYLLPRSEEPEPEVSDSELPHERDSLRLQDLGAIQVILEAYAEERGGYPDTDGGVQSLCVFHDLDEGCALLEIDELPEDPLGNPGANGYFYASDGETYTVYAQREASSFPICDHHPEFLETFESLLCVTGP